jgi:HK97 family phage prohead protease
MLETRTLGGEFKAGDGNTLVGYAAKFNSLSENLGGFREVIHPGAFTRSLASGFDVRALVDHDTAKVIGRRSNGTLSLNEDDIGLRIEVTVPDTTTGRDILTLVRGGYVSQCSFGFTLPPGGDSWGPADPSDNLRRRTLKEISVSEVSIVTFPAYQATEIGVRSLKNAMEMERARRNLEVLALRWRGFRRSG